jgi:hypothetical protein
MKERSLAEGPESHDATSQRQLPIESSQLVFRKRSEFGYNLRSAISGVEIIRVGRHTSLSKFVELVASHFHLFVDIFHHYNPMNIKTPLPPSPFGKRSPLEKTSIKITTSSAVRPSLSHLAELIALVEKE